MINLSMADPEHNLRPRLTVIGVGGAGGGAQGLMPSANRAATIKVREGAQIAVLVAHDLDFSGTPAWR